VSVRSQRTRWGSCSRNGNISLNLRLVLLPEDLADYVILHELVHTRIPNHGRGFWEELGRHVGNGKAFASRLREYGYGLP
jgi:predicted metal-dependent hydrolase